MREKLDAILVQSRAARARSAELRKRSEAARGPAAVDYRLYLLDLAGRILHAADFQSGSDQQAIDLVRRRRELTDVELWSGQRKVALIRKNGMVILPAQPAPASPWPASRPR